MYVHIHISRHLLCSNALHGDGGAVSLTVHGSSHDACHHTLHVHLRYQSSDVGIQQWVDVEPRGFTLHTTTHQIIMLGQKVAN